MEKEFKEAELEKLKAETAILKMQLAKQDEMKRRDKFPFNLNLDLKSIIQAFVAGTILAGAFFFIFQPIVASYKAISDQETKVASLNAEQSVLLAKQGILKSQIQEEENRILELKIQTREKFLKKENEKMREELISLVDKSQKNEVEKRQSAETAREIKKKFTQLVSDYEELANQAATSKSEKELYTSLAKKTQTQVGALKLQVSNLESESQGAANTTKKLQEQLNTREIPGTRVYVGYYLDSKEEAKKLITKLESLGAIVKRSLNEQSRIVKQYRGKNSLLHPVSPDLGTKQLLTVASSEIAFGPPTEVDLPAFREPIQILLYK